MRLRKWEDRKMGRQEEGNLSTSQPLNLPTSQFLLYFVANEWNQERTFLLTFYKY